MMRRLLFSALVALAGLPVGCSSMRGASGVQEVQETVRQRSGFQVNWDQQPTPEASVMERVRTILEGELTAEHAVEVALLVNRRLQSTFEELEIARADMVQAGLPANPILSGELRFPGRPARPFELSVTQAFLDLLQIRMRRRLAEATFQPAKLRAADDMLSFVAEVRGAFYGAQAAEQVVAMRGEVLEAARVAAELAVRQHEAGNISDLDLENQQALYEQAKVDLAQAESEAFNERERLNSLMGLWGPQTDWRIAAALPELPPAEPGLEGMESLAVSQRLDLMVAKQEIEVAARALPLARANAIGDIALGVHQEREPEGKNTTGPAIEVPLPLYNRGRPARARAEALLRQNLQRYAALAVEVRAEVRSVRNRVETARAKAEYYRDVIVPRRQRIVGFSQQHYNYMLLGPFQLLMAKQDEIMARREYIEAVRDYWIGRSELERVLGGRLEAVEPADSAAGTPEFSGHSEETVESPGHHDGGDR